MPWLFLLFVAVPVIELWLLIRIGKAIHAGPTIALVILTGIIGAALARREGMRAMTKIQERIGSGHIPTDEMIEGMMIFVAAVLLVTPGVITDAVGFGLLIAPIRRMVRKMLQAQFSQRISTKSAQSTTVHFGGAEFFGGVSERTSNDDQFIDVAYKDVTPESNDNTNDR
ncbi:MAG: membrane protein FxsA [Phycisphaerae bacterium]|nr:MAG: membrane protein FxsA [Phycisphaerae bacterium]